MTCEKTMGRGSRCWTLGVHIAVCIEKYSLFNLPKALVWSGSQVALVCLVKLATFRPDLQPHCDRCQLEEATLSLFFEFVQNGEFLKSTCKFISDGMGIFVKSNAILCLFRIVPQFPYFNQNNKILLVFATLLTWRKILLQFKDKSLPTFKFWLIDLFHNLTVEIIRYVTSLCLQNLATGIGSN